MFVVVEDLELARLIAAAPDGPTVDEMWELCPPIARPLDDRPEEPEPVVEGPVETDPGGWTALDLDVTTTDPQTLSDAQLVDAMAGFGRVATWAQARQTRLVAEFDRRRPASTSRYTPDEVALAVSMSRFSASGLIERSRRLVDTLHDTLAAFDAGRVDGFKVRIICDAVRYLDDAQAEWVQDQVLDRAPQQSVAQLRAALARAVIAADTEGANARHHRARKDRRVGVGQEQDGMATVWASLAAQDAQQVYGTLTGLARSLGADDPRGMDARRADLLVGLMTGEISIAFPAGPAPDNPATDDPTLSSAVPGAAGHDEPAPDGPAVASRPACGISGRDAGDDDAGRSSAGRSDDTTGDATASGGAGSCPACAAQAWRAARPQIRPVNPSKPLVQVLIAHSTLRSTDHAPAELVGYGAICADQAREIASDAVWRRLVYDDLTGALLDHGRRTYRPPATLADHVRARDVHCRSPLCRRRAVDCELDHTIAFPHGPTAEPNLAAVCLLHHDEKHLAGWTVVQHPNGRIDWTTPTGHVHTSLVHDYRPLPPPPPPSVPGPIADRTGIQPTPPTPPARGLRGGYDWTEPGSGVHDGDPAPF